MASTQNIRFHHNLNERFPGYLGHWLEHHRSIGIEHFSVHGGDDSWVEVCRYLAQGPPWPAAWPHSRRSPVGRQDRVGQADHFAGFLGCMRRSEHHCARSTFLTCAVPGTLCGMRLAPVVVAGCLGASSAFGGPRRCEHPTHPPRASLALACGRTGSSIAPG